MQVFGNRVTSFIKYTADINKSRYIDEIFISARLTFFCKFQQYQIYMCRRGLSSFYLSSEVLPIKVYEEV
jgi:hypothetical protein